MGIIIDIILIAIIALSAFLGYKKGLVKLATRLFAGIIAIIITIILYRPIAGIIIKNTSIDDKIENVIMQNTTNFINDNTHSDNFVTDQLKDELLPQEARNMAQGVVYAITSIILFVFIKIALSLVISLMDFVANLPILKQFNEVGGILYGFLRGLVITCICVLIMGAFIKMNPQSMLSETIQNTYLTKIVYKVIVRF